jgi:hypothetical protein
MGGLRVFTNLLVDNARPVRGLSDQAQQLQRDGRRAPPARRLRELEDYIDAQSGGPGKGWFRIVKDPFEARRVISEGKLAVIMGIEVSKLFDCGITTASPSAPRRRSTSGSPRSTTWASARWSSSTSSTTRSAAWPATRRAPAPSRTPATSTRRASSGRCGRATGPEHPGHDRDSTRSTRHNDDSLIANGINAFLAAGTAPVYPAPPHCNAYGLTELGRTSSTG